MELKKIGNKIILERYKTNNTTKDIEWLIDEETGCWNCISHKQNKGGYITISINRKNIYLHRFMYEKYRKEIPKYMVIRHLCNNPQCSNPNHLEIGTHWDNAQDKVKSGRSGKGVQKSKEHKQNIVKANIKKRKPVVQLDFDLNLIKEYSYIGEVDNYGFDKSSVISVCKGKGKTHKGYKWMYKSDYEALK